MVESLGLKRIYAAGLTVFVLASLACAFAPTLPVLVGARLIQGAGAAGLSVAGIALVRVVYPRGMVSKGLALVALAVAIPGALGPTIAAAILAVAKWPWLFLVNFAIRPRRTAIHQPRTTRRSIPSRPRSDRDRSQRVWIWAFRHRCRHAR